MIATGQPQGWAPYKGWGTQKNSCFAWALQSQCAWSWEAEICVHSLQEHLPFYPPLQNFPAAAMGKWIVNKAGCNGSSMPWPTELGAGLGREQGKHPAVGKVTGWQGKGGRREICTHCPYFPIHWIFSVSFGTPCSLNPSSTAMGGQKWPICQMSRSLHLYQHQYLLLSLLAVTPLTHPKIKFTYFMVILTSG